MWSFLVCFSLFLFWLYCSLKNYYSEHFFTCLLMVPNKKFPSEGWNDVIFGNMSVWYFQNLINSLYKIINSVTQSCLTHCDPMDCMQHAGLPCPSPTPRVCSNSCPLSQWRDAITSSSIIPFSSCLQYFPASGSFPMSQFFTSGGQSIGASASVLPMNIQDWFPLRWTGWISLQSKGLSRVFSYTTVEKHQFFGTQLSL